MQVNGEYISLNQINSLKLEGLVEFLNLKEKKIAVQINGKIVQEANYEKIKLNDNDKIEILYFASGG